MSYYDYAYCGSEIGLMLDKCNHPEVDYPKVATPSIVVPTHVTETQKPVVSQPTLTRMTTDTVVPGENAPQATRVVSTPERVPERAPGRTIVRGVAQSETVQNATARIINRG